MSRLRRASPGVLAVVSVFVSVASAEAAASTYVVTIEQMRFDPPTVVMHRGDSVVWVNKDLVAHTVTTEGTGFDSGSLAPEASWRYVAKEPGHLRYKCLFHQTMHGTLIVEPTP